MRLLRRRFFVFSALSMALLSRGEPSFAQSSATPTSVPAQLTAPQPASDWIKAVRSVVNQTAADAQPSQPIYLDSKNLSDLDVGTAAALRREFEAELTSKGFSVSQDVSAPVHAELDFSEGASDYLLIVRLHGAEGDRVEIAAGPDRSVPSGDIQKDSLVLERTPVWKQSGEFLDFQELPGATDNDSPTLLILQRDSLRFYVQAGAQWLPAELVSTTHTGPWPRDTRGWIDLNGKKVELTGVECAAEFARPRSLNCSVVEGSKFPKDLAEMPLGAESLAGHDLGASLLLDGQCNGGRVVLASGAGDWTQPDTLQAYELKEQTLMSAGDPLLFRGPILTMWPSADQKGARIVWRDLQTGIYEATFVSVHCGN
jgi:hypothetical protein